MSEVVIKLNTGVFSGIKKANTRGLQESARFVWNQAKDLAPVDQGRLRNSIMYSIEGNQEGLNSVGGEPAIAPISSKDGEGSATVGFNLLYGIYQEYGTRRTKAKPFLRPAGKLLNITGLKEITRSEMKKALSAGAKKVIFSSVK